MILLLNIAKNICKRHPAHMTVYQMSLQMTWLRKYSDKNSFHSIQEKLARKSIYLLHWTHPNMSLQNFIYINQNLKYH